LLLVHAVHVTCSENNLIPSHEGTKKSEEQLGGFVAWCEIFMVIRERSSCHLLFSLLSVNEVHVVCSADCILAHVSRCCTQFAKQEDERSEDYTLPSCKAIFCLAKSLAF